MQAKIKNIDEVFWAQQNKKPQRKFQKNRYMTIESEEKLLYIIAITCKELTSQCFTQ